MLLSFMLELLSRHRHSLLMKGIACLGVGCVCACVFASVNNDMFCVCMHAYACLCFMCLAHNCVCVCVSDWVGGDCGDSCALDWGAWQLGHPQLWKVRVCLPWGPYNGLSQFAWITHFCWMTYVTCYVHWLKDSQIVARHRIITRSYSPF